MDAMIKRDSLNGEWTLRYFAEDASSPQTPAELHDFPCERLTARVPGNVELDLSRAGVLPKDLYFGDHILKLRKYESYQWWYEREFETPPWADWSETELVFEGLDCFATIWLNGTKIGNCANALVEHRFEIGELLNKKNNLITIRLSSPVNAVKHRPIDINTNTNMHRYESLWARKPAHCYGWDILPRALSAGLWRDVYLTEKAATELEHVFIDTLAVSEDEATVVFHFDFRTNLPVSDFSIRIRGKCGDSVFSEERALFFVAASFRIKVKNPRLWWPRGYGEAHLYEVEVHLLHRGQVVSCRKVHFGIRTVQLDLTATSTPEQPGAFAFVVNGEKIFCRGANWVPADVFHSRDKELIPKKLELFRDLDCNMLRCWGGNVYEPHEFFDFCDRNGIMVWQDFSMACSFSYPQQPEFLEMIRAEAEWVVAELRQHASIVLWCGDNECDACMESLHRFFGDRRKNPDDNRLTREVIPEVLRLQDPARPYIPSSPYISPEAHASNAHGIRAWAKNLIPEQHSYPPFIKSEIMATSAVFMGEIGFKAFPCLRSMKQFLGEKANLPYAEKPEWALHSTNTVSGSPEYGRVDSIVQSVKAFFGTVPSELPDLILASQIVQAEALKFVVELFRRRKGATSGILWWNMIDGWPQFSDAVVDSYFRKKLAYHYLKRINASLAVIIREPEEGVSDIVVVNDSMKKRSGQITIRNLESGAPVWEGRFDADVNGRNRCGRLPVSDAKPSMLLIEWREEDGGRGHSHYLCGKPPFDFSTCKQWLKQIPEFDDFFNSEEIEYNLTRERGETNENAGHTHAKRLHAD